MALALMTEQTIRVQRLIEDLLILSHLENEQNKVSEKNVNIVDLLHDVLQDNEVLSAARGQVV